MENSGKGATSQRLLVTQGDEPIYTTFTAKALEEALKALKKNGNKDDVLFLELIPGSGNFCISIGPSCHKGVTAIDHNGKAFTVCYHLTNVSIPF